METLLEFLDISAQDDLRRRIELIERDLNMVAHKRSQVDVLPQADLDSTFEIAFKRLEAANRAWGITNKLKNPEDRRVNRKRIAANLNILRSLVARLETALTSSNQSAAGIQDEKPEPKFRDNFETNNGQSGINKNLGNAVRDGNVATRELKKNPFGSRRIGEDVEKNKPKSGIKKELVKAVKDEKVATKELKKNPFGKKKK